MKPTRIAVAVALSACLAAPLHAQFATGPVASNAFITMGGLDWAWANPLPAEDGFFFISSFQVSQGWRLPTAAEMLNAPKATDFEFAGANVPLGGSDPGSGATFQATNGNLTEDAACATPWFSSTYHHCDWQDGDGQFGPWNGEAGAPDYADQLVVREDVVASPEPASLMLLATGLVGIGAVARRKKTA